MKKRNYVALRIDVSTFDVNDVCTVSNPVYWQNAFDDTQDCLFN